jgi:hypothetical protein
MHPPQIVGAIQDLFEEKINICKKKRKNLEKYLKVKKTSK